MYPPLAASKMFGNIYNDSVIFVFLLIISAISLGLHTVDYVIASTGKLQVDEMCNLSYCLMILSLSIYLLLSVHVFTKIGCSLHVYSKRLYYILQTEK